MFTLPKLSYGYGALEPYIDAKTMEIHYTKHHQAYVDNLNKALEKHPELQDKSAEELLKNLDSIPEDIRTAVRNNAGGHSNHTFFWKSMIASSKFKNQSSKLSDEIGKTFGGFEEFKKQFVQAALSRFGSGWVWLALSEQGESKGLKIYSTANQDSPISQDDIPLLALDVWEHAYYLKYQNRRAEYIDAFWNIVDWNEADRRFREYSKK